MTYTIVVTVKYWAPDHDLVEWKTRGYVAMGQEYKRVIGNGADRRHIRERVELRMARTNQKVYS